MNQRRPRTEGPVVGRYGARPQAPQTTWREKASGCANASCMGLIVLFAFIVAILVALGVVDWVLEASIDRVGRRVAAGAVTVLGEPLTLGLVGAGLILFSVGVLLRMFQRRQQTAQMLEARSTPGFTRANLLVGIGIVVLIGAVGAGVLLSAVTNRPGTPSF